jgi:hypothetical protein
MEKGNLQSQRIVNLCMPGDREGKPRLCSLGQKSQGQESRENLQEREKKGPQCGHQILKGQIREAVLIPVGDERGR